MTLLIRLFFSRSQNVELSVDVFSRRLNLPCFVVRYGCINKFSSIKFVDSSMYICFNFARRVAENKRKNKTGFNDARTKTSSALHYT